MDENEVSLLSQNSKMFKANGGQLEAGKQTISSLSCPKCQQNTTQVYRLCKKKRIKCQFSSTTVFFIFVGLM